METLVQALAQLHLPNNTVAAVLAVTAAAGGTSLTLNAESTGDQVVYTGAAGVDTVDGLTNTFTGTITVDGKISSFLAYLKVVQVMIQSLVVKAVILSLVVVVTI